MMAADALGVVHAPAGPAPRIVSLVPSVTELLCALGLAPFLVGRTGFCIHPREVLQAIPKVGGTKDVNVEKVRALQPTHLLVNIDENEKPVVDTLAAFIPHVVVTHPLGPGDNPALYQLLGGIFNAGDRAAQLCAAFEREYAQLQSAPKGPPQTVLYCIWKDPWMTVSGDTYIARMLEQIGWHCWTPPGSTSRYPEFRWSDRLAAAVDMVLLSTEPYRFTEGHVDALERQVGKPVLLVDGEMLSWYGSRAIAGLGYLRALGAGTQPS
ncbi:MAG TPA: helical backbone metal receptor [Noviherbaspirillum sp.]|jgi:ABC-type Fe3+-hydroxamate transport system substrate-binding protein|uniref:helical backbone metal receptor n=1 Tax=Noviherbaspirillum sp. TaxID=1926288 RepID=UPI002F93F3A3